MVVKEPSLQDSTIAQIRAGWVGRLELNPSNLEESGLTLIPREGSTGITSLKILDSIVVICQPALLPMLTSIPQDDFFNMPLLLGRLTMSNANPIGIATISYADTGTLENRRNSILAHEGNLKDVESVLSACTESEHEESGVSTMPTLFVTESSTGKPASVAGYEIWNDKIAQMGVLTKPEYRGLGFAFSTSHAASHSALGQRLIPQWRCRIGNSQSDILSQKLGFRKVGLQLAIDVAPV